MILDEIPRAPHSAIGRWQQRSLMEPARVTFPQFSPKAWGNQPPTGAYDRDGRSWVASLTCGNRTGMVVGQRVQRVLRHLITGGGTAPELHVRTALARFPHGIPSGGGRAASAARRRTPVAGAASGTS